MSTPTRPPTGRPPAPKPVERRPESRQESRPERRPERTMQAVLEKARPAPAPLKERKDERERERQRAERRRLAIVWGRRLGYVVAAGMLVWLVLLSPVFAMDPAKVQISGYGTVVDPTQVRDVIDTHEGASLATLSVGHLASELRDIPGVREAHVSRQWPDGLVVTLVSREPVAAIPDPAGGFMLVDDTGVQVGRASKAPKGLPSLTVPADSEKVLTAALEVIDALPADLKDRVRAVTAATEDSVSFQLTKGPLVEWGSAEDSQLKAKVLVVLLESKQARKADVIDVSAPTLPITKNN